VTGLWRGSTRRVAVLAALTAAAVLWVGFGAPAGAASAASPGPINAAHAAAAKPPRDCDAGATLPRVKVAQPPQYAPEFPGGDAPQGCGPNVVISGVGNDLFNDMTGYSWHAGDQDGDGQLDCPVGQAGLRVVHVNYWGFDGSRYRGAIVVGQDYAAATGDAFSDLYRMGFRIRRMQPLGSQFGHTPGGAPGADDRESMNKDNTSGFNCRYVTFKEASRQWSPHRCGWAIDVNPWENPESTDNVGPQPDAYYYDVAHRQSAGSMSGLNDPAVKAFTTRGFAWLNSADYQHFGIRNYSACTL
jgi:D-alanyl-D-alanine carboxypeptidase